MHLVGRITQPRQAAGMASLTRSPSDLPLPLHTLRSSLAPFSLSTDAFTILSRTIRHQLFLDSNEIMTFITTTSLLTWLPTIRPH